MCAGGERSDALLVRAEKQQPDRKSGRNNDNKGDKSDDCFADCKDNNDHDAVDYDNNICVYRKDRVHIKGYVSHSVGGAEGNRGILLVYREKMG